jgi:hypothetical protein
LPDKSLLNDPCRNFLPEEDNRNPVRLTLLADPRRAYDSCMGKGWLFGFVCVLAVGSAAAAPKPHVVAMGKAITVTWYTGLSEDRAVDLKVRALYVDHKLKEYITGSTHEITDRLFVVLRAYKINDSLPEEIAPRWRWERGGWLVVDLMTGRISPLHLPDFDPSLSAASWYREYVSYCGVAEDGRRVYAVVAQLGRRKPLFRKMIEEDASPGEAPACPVPSWERKPARVIFQANGQKLTFSIRGGTLDVISNEEEETSE